MRDELSFMQNRIKTSRLTRAGLLTAIVTLLTAYLKIPLPAGYAHLGDGAVMLCGMLLGPYGAIPAALGSVLADIILGFVYYAPCSAVIKGAMALIAAKFITNTKVVSAKNILAVLTAFLWMVFAYLLVDAVLYSRETAVLAIGGNLMQAGVGSVVSISGIHLSRRLKWRAPNDTL